MRMNGTPPELLTHPDVLELIMPILRADFEAIETYRSEPHPPLGCRIVALGGRDEEGSVEAAASWRAYTRGEFRSEILPGDHFFLRGRADRLFEILNRELGCIDGR